MIGRRQILQLTGAATLYGAMGARSLASAAGRQREKLRTVQDMIDELPAHAQTAVRVDGLTFLGDRDVLGGLPFKDVKGGVFFYDDLTGVAEVLKIAGGDLDVDHQLVEKHGERILLSQRRMKFRALSNFLDDRVINGNTAADVREFTGLRHRVHPLWDLANAPAPKGLVLGRLDDAISAVPGATNLIMSKHMRNRLSNAGRRTEVFWKQDRYGARRAYYRRRWRHPLPILVTDYDDKNQQTIDFNEPFLGEPTTSIYVVRFGRDGVHGVQNNAPDIDDLGHVASGVHRIRMEWLINIAAHRADALARVHGIAQGPVIA